MLRPYNYVHKNYCLPDFSWSNRHRNCCCRPTLFRHVVRVVVYRRVDRCCTVVVRVSTSGCKSSPSCMCAQTDATRRFPWTRRLLSLTAQAVVSGYEDLRGEVNWRQGGEQSDGCRVSTENAADILIVARWTVDVRW